MVNLAFFFSFSARSDSITDVGRLMLEKRPAQKVWGIMTRARTAPQPVLTLRQ